MASSSKFINILGTLMALALIAQATLIVRERLVQDSLPPDSPEAARAALSRMARDAEGALEVLAPGVGLKHTTLTLTTMNTVEDPRVINVTYTLAKYHRLVRTVRAAGDEKVLESTVLAARVMSARFIRPASDALTIQLVVMTEPKQGRRISCSVKLTPGKLPTPGQGAPSPSATANVLAQVAAIPEEIRTPRTPTRAELNSFISRFWTNDPSVEMPEHYCPN